MLKLAEMSNDQAMDVMAVLATELHPIFNDEEAINAVKFDFTMTDDENNIEYGFRVFKQVLASSPLLFKTYRRNVYRIIGVFLQITEDEVSQRPFLETIGNVKSIFQDEDFVSFLQSSKASARSASLDTLLDVAAFPQEH